MKNSNLIVLGVTGGIAAYKAADLCSQLAKEFDVEWLPSDFKKKEGYKRSIELSAEYDLYRQDYCGCAFSKAEGERRKIQMLQ